MVVIAFFISMLASFSSVAEEAKEGGLKIPAEIKPILIKEMLAIEQGMQALVSSIAKGDWEKTASIGKQIQESYIMKQSLTAEQIHELHHTLPEEFVRLDHAFHGYAGMLAHAAKARNKDITNFYFYKMNESCNQCHSRFANERFPSFAPPKKTDVHHKH